MKNVIYRFTVQYLFIIIDKGETMITFLKGKYIIGYSDRGSDSDLGLSYSPTKLKRKLYAFSTSVNVQYILVRLGS